MSETPCPRFLGVYAPREYASSAQQLADTLQSPLLDDMTALPTGRLVLQFSQAGLGLYTTGQHSNSIVRVDFVGGAASHRRRFGGGKGQMIAKAIGLKSGICPKVLDLTAGMGQDGFVLASLGCHVTWVERSPIVHALLQDGLLRLQQCDDPQLQQISRRLELIHDQGQAYLQRLTDKAQVIYLDPMFPPRRQLSEVNKNMQAFHQLVGKDEDAGVLLAQALCCAKYRVVVKRPRKAPVLGEGEVSPPALALTGKSTRFDVYPLASLKHYGAPA